MTTELDVLNHVMTVVGEQPVSSASSTHPTAQSIMVTVNRVSKQFQLRGWWFNTEIDLPLSASTADGSITLPQGTIKVRPRIDKAQGCNYKLVQRGLQLYDSKNHTYNIGRQINVDCIIQLDIESLPEVAAMYLMHKAAYDYYVADDGDQEKATALGLEVQMAWAALMQQAMYESRVNAMSRPLVGLLHLGERQVGSGYNLNPTGGL